MDWGIVVSVLVANVILILGFAAIGFVLFGLAARGMRKEIKAGGMPKCPMPGCPFHEEIVRAAEGELPEQQAPPQAA